MKYVIRGLLGLLVVGAILLSIAIRNRLIFFGANLYLVFILISVFSRRIRVHRLTFELHAVMFFASLFSLLLLFAGIFLLVRIPISATTSIGIDRHFLFVENLYSARFAVGAQPQATFGLRVDGKAIRVLPTPMGWIRSDLPTFLPAILIAIPTGLAWLVRIKPNRPGRCAKCDYDLTGNTSGVCPECGMRVEPVR